MKKIGTVLGSVVFCVAALGGEIHEAAELGDLPRLKECLSRDPKQINNQDSAGRTVLTRALLSGKKEIVEFLLEKGAPEDIFAAAALGHVDRVASLLKQNQKLAASKDSAGKSALHWAALYGEKKTAEQILAEKVNVNLLDDSGFTPLHWAVLFDRREVVDLLLANKADTTIKVAKFGWTPLRLAVIHGHVAAAEALINGGADPNLRDDENIPLLNQAVINGNKAMVELLLAKKANVNAKDSEGDAAVDEALETGNKDIETLLREHGGKSK